MSANNKRISLRMLFLIATPKLVNKAAALFKEGNVPVQYLFYAQGTASSEIMDTLGLGSIDKNVLISMLPKVFADKMLVKLRRELHLGMPNTGVAFTITISGASARTIKMLENLPPEESQETLRKEVLEVTENEYNMILVIVNQGFSEEVMDAARPAGASGGTAFHCRRIGNEDAMRFWSISVQQEREIVLILAKKEDKRPIMQAIAQKCGMQSEAGGMVLSLPVDGVEGIN